MTPAGSAVARVTWPKAVDGAGLAVQWRMRCGARGATADKLWAAIEPQPRPAPRGHGARRTAAALWRLWLHSPMAAPPRER